jgi:hypothetical protein
MMLQLFYIPPDQQILIPEKAEAIIDIVQLGKEEYKHLDMWCAWQVRRSSADAAGKKRAEEGRPAPVRCCSINSGRRGICL